MTTNVAYPRDDLTAGQAAAARTHDEAAAAAGAPTTPTPSAAHDFYGWHADNGHAPQWDGAGGVACGSCGETYPAPEPEPGAGL